MELPGRPQPATGELAVRGQDGRSPVGVAEARRDVGRGKPDRDHLRGLDVVNRDWIAAVAAGFAQADEFATIVSPRISMGLEGGVTAGLASAHLRVARIVVASGARRQYQQQPITAAAAVISDAPVRLISSALVARAEIRFRPTIAAGGAASAAARHTAMPKEDGATPGALRSRAGPSAHHLARPVYRGKMGGGRCPALGTVVFGPR